MDEGSHVINFRYSKKERKVNIFPIDVDFPLPKEIVGSDKRMNVPIKFEVPKELGRRNRPTCLIGDVLRVDEVLRNHKNYMDKEITVAGWANSTRLQDKDTLLFIELTDGTASKILQVVVKQ